MTIGFKVQFAPTSIKLMMGANPEICYLGNCFSSRFEVYIACFGTGEWDRWGVVDLYQGVGGGKGGGYYLIVLFFVFICAFVFLSLMSCLIFK